MSDSYINELKIANSINLNRNYELNLGPNKAYEQISYFQADFDNALSCIPMLYLSVEVEKEYKVQVKNSENGVQIWQSKNVIIIWKMFLFWTFGLTKRLTQIIQLREVAYVQQN